MAEFRRTISCLLLLVVATFIALGIAEFTVRHGLGGRFGNHVIEGGTPLVDRPVFYRGDEILGWSPTPNLDHDFRGTDFTTRIATDQHGYRLGKLGAVDPGSEVVVVSGDSYTFGWGVGSGETYSSYLDVLLHEQSKGRTRVANLGVGGYGTTQSARRLKQYVDRREYDRIRAIFFLHSHNDFSDNVKFMLVNQGRAEYRPKRIKGLRRLHLVNLATSAWERVWQGGPTKEEQSKFGDVLFSVIFQQFDLEPSQIAIGDFEINSTDITEMDTRSSRALERSKFSGIQEALMRRDISALNCASEGSPVIHAVIHSAPDWYVAAIERFVRESDECGNPVVFSGRVPASTEFKGQFSNKHSGGHFSPELNRYYAEKFVGFLVREGVLERRQKPTDS